VWESNDPVRMDVPVGTTRELDGSRRIDEMVWESKKRILPKGREDGRAKRQVALQSYEKTR
jgi:hypothetical protein